MIERRTNGYKIKGYDNVTPSFTYFPPHEKDNDPVITVGGISDPLLEFESGRFYSSGVVVEHSGVYYRVTKSHTAGTSFNSDNFAVSSGAVTIKDGGVVTAEIADNAVTLAKMASGTDGNIISFDSSGNPVAIPTGNDGQVLTSAGAGAQPAFEDAGGGDMVLLSTTNASTASTVDLTGNFTTTYSNYMVRGVDIFGSNSTETLMMQVIFDSTAITGSVYYGHLVRSNNSSNNYSGQAMNGTTAFNIINQLSSGSTQGTGFVLNVLNAPATNNSYKFFTWNGASAEGWSINYGAGGVNDATSSNMTGMRFLMSAGTVSGKFLLYGIK